MCKPQKANGADRRTVAELRAAFAQAEQLAEWWATLERKANPRADCFSGGFCDCPECRGEPWPARKLGGGPDPLTVSMAELLAPTRQVSGLA